jgi:integrase
MLARTERNKYLQRYPDGTVNFRFKRRTLGTLPGKEGSAEFNDEYDRLLASVSNVKARKVGRPAAMAQPKSSKITIGTFVERYRASDFFANPLKPNLKEEPLAEGTQYNYRLGLDLMHAQDMTARSFADLTPQRASLYIKKVKREHGGAAAGLQKTLLSNLWKFARGFEDFDGGDRLNPMNNGEIETPYTVKQEHLPWPESVQDDFLAACDENLYVAFHLLICTGQRVSDVVKMKTEHYDGTHFALVQKKDRSKTPMKIKAPKLLRDVLAANTKRKTVRIGHNGGPPLEQSEYLLTHKWGRAYGAQSLALRIRETLRRAGHTEYTTHGLRKNAGIMLAENGATVPQIMAALGHKTPKMALYYCRLANQKLLADQAADILDIAFGERAERRQAKVAGRRASMKVVP